MRLRQHGYRLIHEGVRTCFALGLLARVVAAQAAPARDSAVASRLSERLHARFTNLAAVEWNHFAESLYFTKEPADSNADGVVIVLVAAADTGWSAIALSDSLPGAVCGVFYGRVKPPLDSRAPPGVITCAGDWAELLHPGAVLVDTTRVFLADDPDLDPPHLSACPTFNVSKAMRRNSEQVLVELVIAPDGTAQTAPIKVVQSSTLAVARVAILIAQQCAYAPGHVGSRAVRTVVRVPIRLEP